MTSFDDYDMLDESDDTFLEEYTQSVPPCWLCKEDVLPSSTMIADFEKEFTDWKNKNVIPRTAKPEKYKQMLPLCRRCHDGCRSSPPSWLPIPVKPDPSYVEGFVKHRDSVGHLFVPGDTTILPCFMNQEFLEELGHFNMSEFPKGISEVHDILPLYIAPISGLSCVAGIEVQPHTEVLFDAAENKFRRGLAGLPDDPDFEYRDLLSSIQKACEEHPFKGEPKEMDAGSAACPGPSAASSSSSPPQGASQPGRKQLRRPDPLPMPPALRDPYQHARGYGTPPIMAQRKGRSKPRQPKKKLALYQKCGPIRKYRNARPGMLESTPGWKGKT